MRERERERELKVKKRGSKEVKAGEMKRKKRTKEGERQ
jgi:hypothetical protein